MNHRARNDWSRFPALAGLSLLGLAALALPARGKLEAPTRTSGQTSTESEASGTCLWWNEDLARIKSIDGLWSTSTAGEFVRLRPERDGDCRISLVEVLTGEVHTYGLDRGGEVVLAHGWIMINQRDHDTLGGQGSNYGPGCDPATDALTTTPAISKHGVSWIEWGPATWRRDHSAFEDAASKPRLVHAMYLADAPPEGAFVRYQLKSGRIEHVPEQGGRLGDELRFRQVQYPNSGRTHLLFCTTP